MLRACLTPTKCTRGVSKIITAEAHSYQESDFTVCYLDTVTTMSLRMLKPSGVQFNQLVKYMFRSLYFYITKLDEEHIRLQKN